MTDLISRKAAIDALITVKSCLVEEEKLFMDCLISDIERLPSEEPEKGKPAEKIIHCRDCVNFHPVKKGSDCGDCALFDVSVVDDDFCSSAKEKKNGRQ